MLFDPLPFETYDRDGLDYNLVSTGGVLHRGPIVNLDRPYRVCLGTAMTFGRYALWPYPAHIRAFNMGYGRLDLSRLMLSRPHIDILQNAASVVVQFSPRPCYLDHLPTLLKSLSCPKTLLIFDGIQPGKVDCLSEFFERIIFVQSTPVWDWYPDHETHRRAANFLS